MSFSGENQDQRLTLVTKQLLVLGQTVVLT